MQWVGRNGDGAAQTYENKALVCIRWRPLPFCKILTCTHDTSELAVCFLPITEEDSGKWDSQQRQENACGLLCLEHTGATRVEQKKPAGHRLPSAGPGVRHKQSQ